MEALLRYLNQNRHRFNLPEEKEIIMELHAPWWSSRTGRCIYKVRAGSGPKYHIVIQDSLSLYGVQCVQNPYEPQFHRLVEVFLPARRGSFDLDGMVYFWSDYLDGDSLRTRIREKEGRDRWSVLFQLAHSIGELQKKHSFESSDFLSELVRLSLIKIGDDKLGSSFMQSTESLRGVLTGFSRTLCSWSHGDLWPEDVFVRDEALKIIDWEWAVQAAPIGVDLVDLYITAAEHILDIPTRQAWLSFFANRIQRLQILATEISALWSSVSLNREDRKHVVIYALIRSAGRVIAQDGYDMLSLVNTYINLASALLEDRVPFVY